MSVTEEREIEVVPWRGHSLTVEMDPLHPKQKYKDSRHSGPPWEPKDCRGSSSENGTPGRENGGPWSGLVPE